MKKDFLESKFREMQSSTDTVEKKTYELLVYMINNAKGTLDSELPGSWELASILNIEHSLVSRAKTNINSALRLPILLKKHGALNTFNSKYFLDLREALKNCGESLPELTFQQFMICATNESFDDGFGRGQFFPHFELHWSANGVFAVTAEQWKNRPPAWNLFEDVAPNNVEVLVYEKLPKEFFVQAIASKSNDQLAVLIEKLEEKAANYVSLRIEKTLIEPIGGILGQLRRVLNDESIRRQGQVSTIAHILLNGYLSEPQTDSAALAVMKTEGWVIGRNENDPYSRDSLNPFVALCYNQYFSEEEKRRFQTDGLSDDGVIEKYYGYQKDRHADVSIVVPYSVSSSTSFPFSIGDKVSFSIKGNSVIVRKAR